MTVVWSESLLLAKMLHFRLFLYFDNGWRYALVSLTLALVKDCERRTPLESQPSLNNIPVRARSLSYLTDWWLRMPRNTVMETRTNVSTSLWLLERFLQGIYGWWHVHAQVKYFSERKRTYAYQGSIRRRFFYTAREADLRKIPPLRYAVSGSHKNGFVFFICSKHHCSFF